MSSGRQGLATAALVTERPAGLLDQGFFRQLFIADRLPGFMSGGLARPDAEALLADQFRLQTVGYAHEFPQADHRVIVWRDQPVGRIIEADQGDHLLVVDLLVAPASRGLGIGTEVLDRVLFRARTTHRPVRLSALVGSPSLHLYERAGFRPEGATPDRVQLVWIP
jgi:GNAT superfamily N-acetyltransferase